jgi:arginyl-tRNA synthetase
VKELHPDFTDRDLGWWQTVSQELMIERQRGDLAAFEVEFQRWFSEQSLHNEGKVTAAMEKLERDGVAYRASKPADAEGDEEEEIDGAEVALWLRATQFSATTKTASSSGAITAPRTSPPTSPTWRTSSAPAPTTAPS